MIRSRCASWCRCTIGSRPVASTISRRPKVSLHGNAGGRDDQARAASHPAVAEPDHRRQDHRALERIADAPPSGLDPPEGDVFVIPTSETGGFDSLARSANELLSKINRIDFDRIGKSISGAAAGLDDTINGPQLKKTLAALEKAMIDVQDIARKLDTDALAGAQAVAPKSPPSCRIPSPRPTACLAPFNTGYGDNSRFRRDLDRLLPQITDAARRSAHLTDLLSRHPEALIKGRTNTGKE